MEAQPAVVAREQARRPVSVALLGAAAFVVTADARVITPLLHVIATEFGTDVGATGVIVTAYTVPFGLFQLVYGPLGDRAGKVRVMRRTLALFAVGTAVCGLAPSLALLSLLRLLTGIAAAAMIPLSLSYIGDTFPYAERQAAIGRFIGAVALGQILSFSIGGVVADLLGWRYIFLIYGAASTAVFVVFWLVTRRHPDDSARDGSLASTALASSRRVLASGASRGVLAAVFVDGFFFYGGFAYVGAFLRDRYDLLYLVIGLLLGGFGIGSLIYSRSAGALVRRLGEARLILLGGAVVCLGYVVIALVPSWPLFLPTIVLVGLGYYMLHSTLQTRATELAPGARGTAVSLFAFSFFLGQGAGAAALGRVVDGPGYVPALLVAGLGMLVLGIAYAWLSARPRPLEALHP